MRGGAAYVRGVEAAVAEYNKTNPGIRVEILPNFRRDAFIAAVAGGAPPDIYADGAQYIISHALAGLVQPLDPYIAASGMDLAAFIPPNMDLSRWDGVTYAI